MLAYQTGGASSSSKAPPRKRFYVDGISQPRVLDDDVSGRKEAPSGMHGPSDEICEVID